MLFTSSSHPSNTSNSYSLNLPYPDINHNLEFRVVHRYLGSIDNDPLNNFFGLDSGANTLLSLSHPVGSKTDITFARTGLNKEYVLTMKHDLFDSGPLKTALTMGHTRRTAASVPLKDSTFAQLILSKSGLLGWTASIIPMVCTNTDFTNSDPANSDTFGLGLTLIAPLSEDIEFLSESIHALGGYRLENPITAIGCKIQTWGHFFTLLLTNSTSVTPSGYIAGSNSTNWNFGFAILRKF